MRKVLLAVGLALATVEPAIADDPAKHGAAADTKAMSAPQDDHTFAMHMADHHRHGIAMADHVIAKGSSADVKAMARKIRSQQQKELAKLEAHKPADKSGHHAPMPKDPDMERAMSELKASSGAKADALFLQNMIVHHAQALVMTQAAVHHLQDGELRALAVNSLGSQAKEIGDLQKLREGKRAAARRAR